MHEPEVACRQSFGQSMKSAGSYKVLLLTAKWSGAGGRLPGGVLVGRVLLPQQLLAAIPPGDHELAVPPAMQRRRCLPLTAIHQPASDLRGCGSSSVRPISHLTVRIAQAQASCTVTHRMGAGSTETACFVGLSASTQQCCTCLRVSQHQWL